MNRSLPWLAVAETATKPNARLWPTSPASSVTKSSSLLIIPRDEDPEAIIEEMKAGVSPADFRKVLAITDRKEAIKTAVALARENDIILVAGKGHETYQEIKGVKHDFDDRKIVAEMIELMSNKKSGHK